MCLPALRPAACPAAFCKHKPGFTTLGQTNLGAMFRQSLLHISDRNAVPSQNSCSGCLIIPPVSPWGTFISRLCGDKVTLGFLVYHEATLTSQGIKLTLPDVTVLRRTKCPLELLRQTRRCGLRIKDSQSMWTKQLPGLCVDLLTEPNRDSSLEVCVVGRGVSFFFFKPFLDD